MDSKEGRKISEPTLTSSSSGGLFFFSACLRKSVAGGGGGAVVVVCIVAGRASPPPLRFSFPYGRPPRGEVAVVGQPAHTRRHIYLLILAEASLGCADGGWRPRRCHASVSCCVCGGRRRSGCLPLSVVVLLWHMVLVRSTAEAALARAPNPNHPTPPVAAVRPGTGAIRPSIPNTSISHATIHCKRGACTSRAPGQWRHDYVAQPGPARCGPQMVYGG